MKEADNNYKQMRQNYQEVKNYLHNDIKVTKEFVQDILRELVIEETRKLITSDYVSNLIEKNIAQHVRLGLRDFGWRTDIKERVSKELSKQVGEIVANSLTVDISIKQ